MGNTAPGFLFETERLMVRWLTPGDVDDMFAVYGDAESMRWVGDGKPIDRAECERWIGINLRNYSVRGYGMCALVLREHDRVAGFCGITHPGGQTEPEIKYALKRELWGRGLATEAARAMLAYAARELHLTRIISTVDAGHVVSRRILARVGMLEVATRLEDGCEVAVYATGTEKSGPSPSETRIVG